MTTQNELASAPFGQVSPGKLIDPNVTMIIVPRERFSGTQQSLESILGRTKIPFELIYVDGGSPEHIKNYLKRMSRQWKFRLLRTEHYLSPNEARNLGLAEVRTKYTVFIDNDVVVSDSWLKNLVRCGEETGAWVVGPTYCIGSPESEIIHHAGGAAHFTVLNGHRHFFEKHFYKNRRWSDVRDQLLRQECDMVEFHCMLVRTDRIRQLGGLDEGLLSLAEHIDLCLATRAAGGVVYYEPTSTVTYVTRRVLSPSDLPFYLRRWSDVWNVSSLRHFQQKHSLADNCEFLAKQYRYATERRQRAITPILKPLRLIFGQPIAERVRDRLDSFLELLMARDRPRASLIAGSFFWNS